MSHAIGDINRIASCDREGVNARSNNILKDSWPWLREIRALKFGIMTR